MPRKISFTSSDYADILTNRKVSEVLLSFLPKSDLLNICLVSRKVNCLARDFLNRRRRTWCIPVLTSNHGLVELQDLEKLVDTADHPFRGIKLKFYKISPDFSCLPVLSQIYRKIEINTLVLEGDVKRPKFTFGSFCPVLTDVDYIVCNLKRDHVVAVLSHFKFNSTNIKKIHMCQDFHDYDRKVWEGILKKFQNLIEWTSFVPTGAVGYFLKLDRQHVIKCLQTTGELLQICWFNEWAPNLNLREFRASANVTFETFCSNIRSSFFSIRILHICPPLFESLLRRKFPTMANVQLVYILDNFEESTDAINFDVVDPKEATREIFPRAQIQLDQRLNYSALKITKYFRSYCSELKSCDSTAQNLPQNTEARKWESGDFFQDNVLTIDLISCQIFNYLSKSDLVNCCLVSKTFECVSQDFLNRRFLCEFLLKIDPIEDLDRLQELEELLQDSRHPIVGISLKFTEHSTDQKSHSTYLMSSYPDELMEYNYLSSFVVSALQRIISKILVKAVRIQCCRNIATEILPTYLSLLPLEQLEYLQDIPVNSNKYDVGTSLVEVLKNRELSSMKILKVQTQGETTTALLSKCPSLIEWGSYVSFSEHMFAALTVEYSDMYSTFVQRSQAHLIRKLCVEVSQIENLLAHKSVVKYRNNIEKIAVELDSHIFLENEYEERRNNFETRCRPVLCQFFPSAEICTYQFESSPSFE